MPIANQLKTVALLALLTAILLWVGSLFGTNGLIIAFAFALLLNFGSYFFSDKIVLMMYRAKPASKSDYPKLYEMVKAVAKKAGLPMPKICIIPSDNSNAFAAGRNERNAVIAFTESILKLLNKEELEGVIGHELAHIKNKDILIQTIAATIAGVISYAATMVRWGAMFGGFGRDREGSSIFELLTLAIVAPIAALLIQLAISRSREYFADSSSANTLKNGRGLASALEKLEVESKRHPMRFGSPATSSLFIVNPFQGGGITALFSTHPPIKIRVDKLGAMKF